MRLIDRRVLRTFLRQTAARATGKEKLWGCTIKGELVSPVSRDQLCFVSMKHKFWCIRSRLFVPVCIAMLMRCRVYPTSNY